MWDEDEEVGTWFARAIGAAIVLVAAGSVVTVLIRSGMREGLEAALSLSVSFLYAASLIVAPFALTGLALFVLLFAVRRTLAWLSALRAGE